jgi:hypothetical protein
MMTLVTGPPGTGKTWYCTRAICNALERGKWVATNVAMHDGFELHLAKRNWLRYLKPGRRAVVAERHRQRCFVSGDLEELMRVRLPGCGKCRGCTAGRTCQREGRGLMVLDEAHSWLNARMWDQDTGGGKDARADAIRRRLAVVDWFAEHRKLGWEILLVTQDAGRIDAQVRGNAEFHTKLKNLRKFKVLGLVPLFPFNVFVAITTWHGTNNDRVGISAYLLDRRCRLYDTMAAAQRWRTFSREDEIWLPLPVDVREARRAALQGTAPAAQTPAVRNEDGTRASGAAAAVAAPEHALLTPVGGPVPAGMTPVWVVAEAEPRP